MTENKPDPPTNQATAEPATLAITIEIIRAGTGKKEIYELVGTPIPPDPTPPTTTN